VDVEWGTEDPGRWKAGVLQKIFAGEETTEPVVVSHGATVRVSWEVRGVHPVFRTESALVELLRRFLLRHPGAGQARAVPEILHVEAVDGRGRAVAPENPECVRLHAEVGLVANA
jgi:hypothetical protein